MYYLRLILNKILFGVGVINNKINSTKNRFYKYGTWGIIAFWIIFGLWWIVKILSCMFFGVCFI